LDECKPLGAGEETMYDGDIFDRMDQFYNTTSGAADVKVGRCSLTR
jgi:hypothetical protein